MKRALDGFFLSCWVVALLCFWLDPTGFSQSISGRICITGAMLLAIMEGFEKI